MSVKPIHTEAEFNSAIASPSLTVVDFYADWCGPCKRIAPFVHQLAVDNADVHFVKVCEADASDIIFSKGVSAFPTFHFYVAGRKVDELRGADPGELSRKVASLKPKAPAAPKPALSPLDALKEEAKRLFGLGKFAAAAEAYTQAIDLEPRASVLYSNRALCALKSSTLGASGIERAIADCEKALSLDAANVKAQYYLGQSLCKAGRVDEGVRSLEAALALARKERMSDSFITDITIELRRCSAK